ncbi:hypothetical protein ACFQMA_03550 [Halosimplex aquaticum]|uniref:Uncharacterized protein n=1 Tax=Halosimplex aquaticum TaxID=3026162 RepID=A0ABD5XZS5_9EURY|nr:hypothetical protein [Halosimplex aquaticum]
MSTQSVQSEPEPVDHLRRIRQVTLPERVERLADAYDDHFEERDRFLWRWIYSLFPSFTLSSVAEEHAAHVREQKTILTMYVTVLDDLIEHRGDRRTFREACRLSCDVVDADPERAAVDAETFAFVERLWTEFADGLADAPRREEFADIFAYDFSQTADAMEYSALLSDNPAMANLTGATQYDSHNMVMFPYADVDLMYSPAFDPADLGALRNTLWDLQELARIGNWLTTWEREVGEGDYSAGIVVAAIEEGVVSPTEVAATDDADAVVEAIRASGMEGRFRRRWQRIYEDVRARHATADSVDLAALVDGMETVFEYHLATEGLK